MRLPLAALCLALSFAPAAAQTVEDGFKAYDAGDYATAKTILLPLAEAGDARAMNLVGYMYDLGKGFPKDPTIACDWYEKAAELGYARAQSNLGTCFSVGEGRHQDIEKGVFWRIRAAEQGHLGSQLNLITYYKNTNRGEARRWVDAALTSHTIIARVFATYAGLADAEQRAGFMEKSCVFILNGILNRELDACDRMAEFLHFKL